jgi:hypothetical protein
MDETVIVCVRSVYRSDYKGMDPQVALGDFMERVKAYEAVYEELADDEDDGNVSYIKVCSMRCTNIIGLGHGLPPFVSSVGRVC